MHTLKLLCTYVNGDCTSEDFTLRVSTEHDFGKGSKNPSFMIDLDDHSVQESQGNSSGFHRDICMVNNQSDILISRLNLRNLSDTSLCQTIVEKISKAFGQRKVQWISKIDMNCLLAHPTLRKDLKMT